MYTATGVYSEATVFMRDMVPLRPDKKMFTVDTVTGKPV